MPDLEEKKVLSSQTHIREENSQEISLLMHSKKNKKTFMFFLIAFFIYAVRI